MPATPGQQQRQVWLGTKWESRALVSALCRSVLLTCARLHLQKHGDDLVAGIGMLSWGSRGRRFKSGRPDWSEACGSDTAPDSWVLIDGRRYLRKVIMLAE